MKMNQDVKKEWVKALRSGKYKQTTGQLRDGDSFCCLGVLCNLHAIDHPEIAAAQTNPELYLGNCSFLPSEVQEWAGLESEEGAEVLLEGKRCTLPYHNDESGATFKEIAKAIEEQL